MRARALLPSAVEAGCPSNLFPESPMAMRYITLLVPQVWQTLDIRSQDPIHLGQFSSVMGDWLRMNQRLLFVFHCLSVYNELALHNFLCVSVSMSLDSDK